MIVEKKLKFSKASDDETHRTKRSSCYIYRQIKHTTLGKKYGDFRYILQRFKSNHKYLLDPWQRIIKVVIVNLVKTE